MQVTITNIDAKTFRALQTLLKPLEAGGVKIFKSEDETSKAIKEYEAEKKAGKTKTYDNLAEFKKAMGV